MTQPNNRQPRPEYHLRRVSPDGQLGPVEIFPLHAPPTDAAMGRRRFLGTGVSLGAAVAALDGNSNQARGQDAPLQPAQVIFAHKKAVRALAFSPDGLRLCSASQDGTAKVWDLDGGVLLHQLLHGGPVNSLSLSADGELLATACADQIVRVWSVPDGGVQHMLAGHNAVVESVAISPAGDLLASGSERGEVRLWNLGDGAERGVIATGHGGVRDLAISAAGDLLVSVGRDAKLRTWTIPAGTLDHEGAGHDLWLNAVAISGGDWIAAAGADRKITLRHRGELDKVRTLAAHDDVVGDVCFSADGSQMASVGKDARVVVWQVADGVHAEMRCPFPCVAAAFSPDGAVLATGDINGAIILWNVRTRKLIGFMYDPQISATDAVVYRIVNRFTQMRVTYSLPFGWPAPTGAVCVTQRVPGALNLVAQEEIAEEPIVEETEEETPAAEERPVKSPPIKRKPKPGVASTEEENLIVETTESTRPSKLTAEERKERLRQVRELRYQQRLERMEAAQMEAQMRYQWEYGQSYPSYGGGGSTTICTCDTISY